MSSYEKSFIWKAIELIALNDEPTITDVELIRSMFSVQLIADLFEIDIFHLSKCISDYRTEKTNINKRGKHD